MRIVHWRRFASVAALLTTALALSGCGGVKVYVHPMNHPNFWSNGEKPLPGITMRVGETRRAIKQSGGMMSIGGGYFWGLVPDDVEIVDVEYRERGRHTYVMLVAGKPGTTRVYHVNRRGFNPMRDRLEGKPYFEVKVVE